MVTASYIILLLIDVVGLVVLAILWWPAAVLALLLAVVHVCQDTIHEDEAKKAAENQPTVERQVQASEIIEVPELKKED